ncbi:3-oxoacyl-[acyl-carrier-protein] synthase [Arachnomyces sp. PD_36]|nr:3-oxoacyl-[acyl-carrier-protein] synthase [Arachnomyces sp. PD_36]
MFTKTEQELTHILLTELLAHQFCFPVQWIDTQDVLLRDFAAERIIEIGPGETLVNMAKKTLTAEFKSHDIARGLRRELLSFKKHADDIYYRQEIESESSSSSSSPSSSLASPVPTSQKLIEAPTAPSTPSPTLSSCTSTAPAPSLPDTPISASDIAPAIISFTLKKPRHEISLDQSIKQLCGGRSTLQNEIIGDLTKEFGSLPEQPEDVPLSDLCSLLQSSFAKKLGSCTQALIGKMVSAKMPAGSGAASLRQHLESRWGFASGLQDKTLLLAVCNQPPSRLSNEKDAQTFFDDLAQKLMVESGIDPSSVAKATSDNTAAAVTVAPEALQALHKEQESFDRRLLELYAKKCNYDLQGESRAVITLNNTVNDLQKQLDTWTSEHGESYGKGIVPKFEPKKARTYDSFWNWVIQDLLSLVYKVLNGASALSESEIAVKIALLESRSTPRLLKMMEYMVNSLKSTQGDIKRHAAREMLIHLHTICAESLNKPPVARVPALHTAPLVKIDAKGRIIYQEVPRLSALKKDMFSQDKSGAPFITIEEKEFPGSDSSSTISMGSDSTTVAGSPHIRKKGICGWHRSETLTDTFLQWIDFAYADGVTFQDKAVLVTGAGKNSIGAEIVTLMLSAGAKVLVTTSSYSPEVTRQYQQLYSEHGGRDSRLIVLPFNQGSQQDVANLVDYIYDPINGLGWDLDHIVPFAAIPEGGRGIDNIDSVSELAHRAMLTNMVRLLGAIKTQKERRRIRTHPSQVILPLSPNHGIFGYDGLYAESKIGLEALLNKWWSEDWNEYLTLCGAIIGWTRGTGLMHSNDILAEGIEEMDMKTFSKTEMALNIAGLMASPIASHCDTEPLLADLSGGLSSGSDVHRLLNKLRDNINSRSEINRALDAEKAIETKEMNGPSSFKPGRALKRRANIKFDFPAMPNYATELQPLHDKLGNMVDLDRVVVAVGFGETGTFGNSRTRWEMETTGKFSLEGCLEMAWIMGLIKYHNGLLKGKSYCGWIDVASDEPIADADVKSKYESYILEHTGIRVIEAGEHTKLNTSEKQSLHEVAIIEDLEPFEVSAETAQDFKREHGDKCDITELESGEYRVSLRSGAILMIPKATKFNHAVGGQIPSGWDPRTYGIPEEIASQVDPTTLYALVSTVEAFLSAGITDPYELYEHIHVSEIGNCLGGGLGGQTSLHKMFKQRYLDRQVQKDILAETFINTTSAWVNMLLLGGSGPIKTPVGACATSLESMDTGFELIASGKVKACLVGGYDGFEQDVAAEFANMQATINVEKEKAAGRDPKQMSRPTAATRDGFVESEGCGIQLITNARLALDMGLPIQGIIALTHTASDKIGRSVPAPGQGILTIVRESPTKLPSPLLSVDYRRRNLELRRRQIQEKREEELLWLEERLASLQDSDVSSTITDYGEECRQQIEADATRQEKDALGTYGMEFWKGDTRISPLRGALAVWGLTVDDLNVASLHGTSTVKNDINESSVLQEELSHLGRKKGNILPCVCQKSLTGHGKGAAGAFALNGCLQMLSTSLIPGNHNADNIDPALSSSDYLLFPNQPIQTPGIKAFSVTSFGFGQKGAQVIGVHPKYLFATLEEDVYEEYKGRVQVRERKAYRAFQDRLMATGGQSGFVQVKDKSPYEEEGMRGFLMDPNARIAKR